MGKLIINIEADVTRHSTQYRGKLEGTLQDLCFFAGMLIGQQLREAPSSADKVVINLFAKGMAAGKFGDQVIKECTTAKVAPDVLEKLKEAVQGTEEGGKDAET